MKIGPFLFLSVFVVLIGGFFECLFFGAAFADAISETFRFYHHPKGRNAVKHGEAVDGGF